MANQLRRCRPLLGTYVEVSLNADLSDDKLLDISKAVYQAIESVEKCMSFHNTSSELSYINMNAHKQAVRISNDMKSVLAQSMELSQMTQGAFDPCVAPTMIRQGMLPNNGNKLGSKIWDKKTKFGSWHDIQIEDDQIYFRRPVLLDLGGIGKGFAVDKAIATLNSENLIDVKATINAGGDLRMTHPVDQVVRLRHPNLTSSSHFQFPMHRAAVATSAGYFSEFSHPIISPTANKSIQDSRSVSVFASTCMQADALTKVAFLSRDAATILESFDARAVYIDCEGNISEC